MIATLIRTPGEITGDWLSAALGREGLRLLAIERIGTGQMSQCHRVGFEDGEGVGETVIVKLASDDPTSRATGTGLGAYYREVAFYRNLATRIGGPVAGCHFAEYDQAQGWFTLVLDDATGAVVGDQIAGATVAQARAALAALAAVHAPVLGDLALGTADWLNQANPLDQRLLSAVLPGFLERYGDRIAPAHAEVCERFVACADAWLADARPPLGLVHGDYRLDNLLFGPDGVKVVDWQTVSWGPAMLDASYFIGGGLDVEDRRAHEQSLLREYHEALLERGVRGFGWEQCLQEYRREAFHGILMTVGAAMLVVRTERGDDMFMTWLARNAQQVLDLGSLELLPQPGSARPAPLAPDADDEDCHSAGPEGLWNESWYFDAVSDDAQLGVYVRLGRLPNQGAALFTACVCGPGRPSVMLVDAAAPLPASSDPAQAIDTGGLRYSQVCEQPLARFVVRVAGEARAHCDPAGPLRGEAGEPLALELELVFETDGVPYAWRQSTRYEIPCRVSGTVTVGSERMRFAGPGQRDHSWGARDWWALDWMWSGLHLDDGTHTHAVAVPQMPGYGVGYVQRGGYVSEIESVTATEEIDPDGLISRARIVSGPDALELDVVPLAFGALRLEAPDGRLSLFPRAMCRVRTGDGRSGTGWVEWNRVQR